ncbi:disintegrin and metalloproteinase domain-containing protein 33-like [Culex pipiens pallens]|uniref:disintegrin and metalloproteinase domain-containing protein 33-like n=1 Tax=Culex pipiens pallens TaxID=42434 RepID=UPI001953EE7C|nr:disintegrin and metalloproteinase domain-containing protein 33-like [Culex pipiens pallens]
MLAAPGAFISTTVIVVIVVVVCGQVQTARLSEPSDAGSQDSSGSGNEATFERYARIFPEFHDSSGGGDGNASKPRGREQRLTISYRLDGENVTLDLWRNDEIVAPEGHFMLLQSASGETRRKQLAEHELERCQYHGTVRGSISSSVALSTCDGISGIVYDTHDTYLIEFDSSEQSHYVQRNPDLLKKDRTKRALETFHEPHPEAFSTAFRSNRESNYVELVLVIDRALYLGNMNVQKVYNYCLDLVNIMNIIYRPLNIYIVLVGVVIWTEQDEIEMSSDSKKTLDNFLRYRRDTLLQSIPHDNAHLLTGVHFGDSSGDGVVVGKAELGSMCTFAGSGGVEVVDTKHVALQASTVAHEMGHNFNMDHDGPECRCPGGNCVMAAKTVRSQKAPSRWSSCSVEHLETGLQHGLGACLKNKPAKMLVKSTCGNGLLEPGEECDCGLSEMCDTKCCDATTCRLTVNATCAAGECCDLDSCQLKSAGSSCRSAVGECDLPEHCSGQSPICPKDVYLRDTEPCAGGQAYCFKGRCRTRDSQCKLLWGSTGRSFNDHCYQTNRNGTIFGNCGNNLLTGEYTKCNQEDIMCGLLHCSHRNEKLDYGMGAYSKLTTTKFTHFGPRGTVRDTVCNAAIVDLGLDVTNPGLVPDGAKCGTGKMCWNQKCVSLAHLKENDVGEECEGGCSDHGVCNSEGNCHCDDGFGGKFCETAGLGGSVDSGPTVDPDSSKGPLALYISLTILLFMIFTGTVYFYRVFLWDYIKNVLQDFRMRKYGHVVPPASPSIMGVAKTARLQVSQPVINSTTLKLDTVPSRAAPPPPKPQTEPAQHFIKVNINKGKITIENKVVNSPFLLESTLLDAHEAVHEMKARGTPAIVEKRSISVDSEGPLLGQSVDRPVLDTPPPLETREPDLVAQISQVKLKKVHDFHSNRSKSDEKPPRRLPELPRQKTIGEFQSVIAEVHPKRSPVTEEPPTNPFGHVTLKKTKTRTPHLSREHLDEITAEQSATSKPTPLTKPAINRLKPTLPQKPSAQQNVDNQQSSEAASKPKLSRKLPQLPSAGPNRSRPPLQRKPAVVVDEAADLPEGGGVAALKARLNLEQIGGGIKR